MVRFVIQEDPPGQWHWTLEREGELRPLAHSALFGPYESEASRLAAVAVFQQEVSGAVIARTSPNDP